MYHKSLKKKPRTPVNVNKSTEDNNSTPKSAKQSLYTPCRRVGLNRKKDKNINLTPLSSTRNNTENKETNTTLKINERKNQNVNTTSNPALDDNISVTSLISNSSENSELHVTNTNSNSSTSLSVKDLEVIKPTVTEKTNKTSLLKKKRSTKTLSKNKSLAIQKVDENYSSSVLHENEKVKFAEKEKSNKISKKKDGKLTTLKQTDKTTLDDVNPINDDKIKLETSKEIPVVKYQTIPVSINLTRCDKILSQLKKPGEITDNKELHIKKSTPKKVHSKIMRNKTNKTKPKIDEHKNIDIEDNKSNDTLNVMNKETTEFFNPIEIIPESTMNNQDEKSSQLSDETEMNKTQIEISNITTELLSEQESNVLDGEVIINNNKEISDTLNKENDKIKLSKNQEPVTEPSTKKILSEDESSVDDPQSEENNEEAVTLKRRKRKKSSTNEHRRQFTPKPSTSTETKFVSDSDSDNDFQEKPYRERLNSHASKQSSVKHESSSQSSIKNDKQITPTARSTTPPPPTPTKHKKILSDSDSEDAFQDKSYRRNSLASKQSSNNNQSSKNDTENAQEMKKVKKRKRRTALQEIRDTENNKSENEPDTKDKKKMKIQKVVVDEFNRIEQLRITETKCITTIYKSNIYTGSSVKYVKSHDNDVSLKTTESDDNQTIAGRSNAPNISPPRKGTKIIEQSSFINKSGVTSDANIDHTSMFDDIVENFDKINPADYLPPPNKKTNEEMKKLKKAIVVAESRIKMKQENLESLKRISIYKKSHNLDELRMLTLQIKRGCQEALIDTLLNLKQHTDMEFNMLTLIDYLKIPSELIGYNQDEDTFV